MLDFARFDWLSFDCYGTLIDWETGLLGYLRPLLHGKGCAISDARHSHVVLGVRAAPAGG